MEPKLKRDHELYQLFFETVGQSLVQHVSSRSKEDEQAYIADLLASFLHTDALFSLRDSKGKQLISVAEMLAEGDISQNADSFERERQVHQFIGDFLLFWQGFSPNFLRTLQLRSGAFCIEDFSQIGQDSYELVSTYELYCDPKKASTFHRLSEGFDAFAFCIGDVRNKLGLLPWMAA